MKRTLFILAALLLFTGCDVEDLTMKERNAIRFTVNTYYETGPKTRTVYSGEFTSTTPQYERIDWLSTDLLRVWAQLGDAGAQGDYKIKAGTISPDGKNSTAEVETVTALNWIDYGTHTFYALYPSPATTTVDGDKVTLNKDVITATIPATQVVTDATGTKVYKPNMDYAYMWAATTADYNTAVSLDFKPLMTAFEFTVKSAGSSFNLASFVLSTDGSSPVIAGDFTAKVSTDLGSCPVTTVTNGSRSITVNLGDVEVTSTAPVTFTIFALPWELKNLTMQFNITGGTTKKLDLKQLDEFVTFAPGKKYRITNVGVPSVDDGWTYTLTEVEPGVAMARHSATAGTATKGMRSYRTKDGVTEAVAMQFSYSPADPVTGANLEQWSTDLPAWLESLLVGEHSGTEQPTDPFTLTGSFTLIPEETEITLNEITQHNTSLRGKAERGESDEPYDLSRYDITSLGSKRSSFGVKTANCYVVDRAGWYMFPLVYGNAIDSEKGNANKWNVNSYSVADLAAAGITTADSTVEPTLLNYTNAAISSPYILDDINKALGDVEPVIVWEDVASGDAFIDAIDKVAAPVTDAAYKAADGSAKTVPYIKFHINKAKITEGNAVIALREKTGDKRIIWSWHIWITDSTLGTINVETRNSTDANLKSNNLLTKPLGMCNDKVETYHYFTPRKYFVMVTQVQGNAPAVEFEVIQDEINYYITRFSLGSHYQYGRKDPFLSFYDELYSLVQGSTDGERYYPYSALPVNKPFYAPEGYTIEGANNQRLPYQTNGYNMDVSLGIQNPYYIYTSGSRDAWWGNKVVRNLWNMIEYNSIAQPFSDDTFLSDLDRKVYKTIYDPCPPGFSVPNYSAFTLMTDDGACYSHYSAPANEHWVNHNQSDFNNQYGSNYFADAATTRTIFIPNNEGRRYGIPVAISNSSPIYPFKFAYYHTVKAKGDSYNSCFTMSTYWVPPGPVAEIGTSCVISVLPAMEK